MATARGPARTTTFEALSSEHRTDVTVALTHGAGGGIESADLVAMAAGLPPQGIDVVLVEQPWRVAGQRLASAPATLDEAFTTVVGQLAPPSLLVVGGRSAGARVACRTGTSLGAAGVLALAFPLHPPGRPGRSRGSELAGTALPTLVLQGGRDPFGNTDQLREALGAAPSARVSLVEIPAADHGFSIRLRDGGDLAHAAALARMVDETAAWLRSLTSPQAEGNT